MLEKVMNQLSLVQKETFEANYALYEEGIKLQKLILICSIPQKKIIIQKQYEEKQISINRIKRATQGLFNTVGMYYTAARDAQELSASDGAQQLTDGGPTELFEKYYNKCLRLQNKISLL